MRIGDGHRGEGEIGRQPRDRAVDDLTPLAQQRPLAHVQRRGARRLAHGEHAGRQRRITRDRGMAGLEPDHRLVDRQCLHPGARDAAQAVEARLRLRAVGVEDAHAERRIIAAGGQQQDAVAPHRPGTVRERAGDLRPFRV